MLQRITGKHWLYTTFLFILVLAATSCARAPERRIGVSLPTLQQADLRTLRSSLVTAARARGLLLDIEDADGENARQIAQVEGFIADKVDALLIVPLHAEAISRAVLEANGAHIPVFTVDVSPRGGETVAHIGTDERSAGRAAGNMMIEGIGNKGKVAILVDIQRGSLKGRIEAFKDRLAVERDVEVAAEMPAEGPEERVQALVAGLLTSYPDLAGLFATSDVLTLGAAQAVTFAGKSSQVAIIGTGGPDLRNTVQSGAIFGALILRPERLGEQAVTTLYRYFQKETIPNLIPVALEPFAPRRRAPVGAYGAAKPE